MPETTRIPFDAEEEESWDCDLQTSWEIDEEEDD
jgi:hypothetical protein